MDNNEELMNAFKELIEGMDPEARSTFAEFAAMSRDRMCGTNNARKHYRAMAEGNEEALHAFDMMCMQYDLNTAVVQSLGNLKAMLEGFDANDFSSVKFRKNLMLHKHISQLWVMSMNTIDQQIQAINREEKDYENRNGDSSG